MSYEGYIRQLCSKGHLTETNVYCQEPTQCSICNSPFVWQNNVDETNGTFEEIDGKMVRIDGYIDLKIKKIKKCKCCKTTLEVLYEIPKKEKI